MKNQQHRRVHSSARWIPQLV